MDPRLVYGGLFIQPPKTFFRLRVALLSLMEGSHLIVAKHASKHFVSTQSLLRNRPLPSHQPAKYHAPSPNYPSTKPSSQHEHLLAVHSPCASLAVYSLFSTM